MLVKNIYNNNSSFIQARNSLVASAKTQLNNMSSAKMNTKNHMLSVLSKNNSIKSGGLIQRSVCNSMRSMPNKSMQGKSMQGKSMHTSFSRQKTSLMSNTMLLSNKNKQITHIKEELKSQSSLKQPPLQYLFHKYALGIRNPNDNSITQNFTIVKVSPITRKNLCHIHCFNLTFLDSMFGIYISLISETFDIIVTFTRANDSIINKYNNITFLCTKNYGMDIGPKFTVYDYLRNKSIEYNYVFYMHSKSDNNRRQQYLLPFIKNLRAIAVKLNENNSNISCYFHNIIQHGDGINDNKWSRYNKVYMDNTLTYLNIKHFKNNTTFVEGNFYILHKQIIDKLFSDKLLYNILNNEISFDYNWVNCFYKLNNSSINEVYNVYKQNKYFGNNMATNKGHNGLADAMIEHVFERLPITLCKEYGVKYVILS
jgi:hypothetical protein